MLEQNFKKFSKKISEFGLLDLDCEVSQLKRISSNKPGVFFYSKSKENLRYYLSAKNLKFVLSGFSGKKIDELTHSSLFSPVEYISSSDQIEKKMNSFKTLHCLLFKENQEYKVFMPEDLLFLISNLVENRTLKLKDIVSKLSFKEDLFHFAIHDINGILTVLNHSLDSLKLLVPKDNSDANAILFKINRNRTRLAELAKEILFEEKISSGSETLTKESFLVKPFIEEITPYLQDIGRLRKIDIRIAPIDNGTIVANKKLIERSIVNIVENAVKYSKKNSTVFVGARIEGKYNHKILKIYIKDEGYGISDDTKINEIFKKFSRDEQTKESVFGVGIGLYLATRFIKAHGGYIEAYNNEKSGSTFNIVLPDAQVKIPKQFKKITVLVVDDDPDILDFLSIDLKSEGMQVVTAGNGQLAIDSVKRYDPDIILTDIKMPVMNGIDLLNNIKQQKFNIPVIFFTGKLGQKEADLLAIEKGAIKAFTKPVNLEKISHAITSAMA